MSQIIDIETHLNTLTSNWDDTFDHSLLELCDSQLIDCIPHSGILHKPGHSLFLLLDPNNHFKHQYDIRYPEVKQKFLHILQNKQISSELRQLKMCYFPPSGFVKYGSFHATPTPLCPPPNLTSMDINTIHNSDINHITFSPYYEKNTNGHAAVTPSNPSN